MAWNILPAIHTGERAYVVDIYELVISFRDMDFHFNRGFLGSPLTVLIPSRFDVSVQPNHQHLAIHFDGGWLIAMSAGNYERLPAGARRGLLRGDGDDKVTVFQFCLHTRSSIVSSD